MKTDYEKLNSFDVALVAMIFIGIAILASTIYLALPEPMRISVNASLAILDMSEDLRDQVSNMSMIVGFSRDFMDEFNVAFIEVASLPSDFVERPIVVMGDMYEQLAMYSSHISTEYQKNNVSFPIEKKLAMASEGKVLGLTITFGANSTFEPVEYEDREESVSLEFPYAYSKPDLEPVITLLDKIK